MSAIETTNQRASEIRDSMRRIRASLPKSVNDAKGEVRTYSDWRCYLKAYPHIILPAASMIGYMLVPPIRPKRFNRSDSRQETKQETAAKSGFLAGLGSVVAGLAIRAASNYATKTLSAKLGDLTTRVGTRDQTMGQPSDWPVTPSRS